MTGMHVGVMGAGQLGRMLALAGIPLGMRFTFLSPTPSPSAESVGSVVIGDYDDTTALAAFADQVDVVTYEFENVSLTAADVVQQRRPLWPPIRALATTQDRLREKEMFGALGIPAAAYVRVDSLHDLLGAVDQVGTPGILKTRFSGYDGKGQRRIQSADDVSTAWQELGGVPLIYEHVVDFERELSVIAVRASDGTRLVYPVVENRHRDGILRFSTSPVSALPLAKRQEAERYATMLLDTFEYVGVFALELFDTTAGLVANEMAPRVHNSGHWTIEGAETSQFENHVRAICGLPLGACTAVGHSAMFNVIGRHPDIAEVLRVPGVHVHMYGKSERPGRKLGHITIRSGTPEDLVASTASLAASSALG